MRQHRRNVCLWAAAVALLASNRLAAQSLDSRISAARGTVAFQYETKPNVCGNGHSIELSDDDMSPGWNLRPRRSRTMIGSSSGRDSDVCELGPARVTLRRDAGQITELRVRVGGDASSADTELGEVSAAEAAKYLLSVAPKLDGRSADHAVMGAEIADGVVVWPQLLKIARDDGASESSRKAAVFWVSREASDAATQGLTDVATDDDATMSVRQDALFFLAQRPRGEGIPALVRVAESSKSMKLRKDAIFFLAQSEDPRALDLFEKLLTGRQ